MIEYGDILLDSSGDLSFAGGDLVADNAKEQHLGTIVNASCGNFTQYPTLGANVTELLDGVADATSISVRLVDAARLDGWEIYDIALTQEGSTTTIEIERADKITDNTNNLI